MAPKDSQKLFEVQDFLAEAPAIYRDLHPWNFSTHILTRIAEELIILEAPDIHWSDWGTREAIERTYRQMKLVPSWGPRQRPARLPETKGALTRSDMGNFPVENG